MEMSIKYLWEGKSRTEVTKLLGCTYKTLTEWIDKFLLGGLETLIEPITHTVPSRLNDEQKLALKNMLLEQKPTDYGIDRHIWTGQIICTVIVEIETDRDPELNRSTVSESLSVSRLQKRSL